MFDSIARIGFYSLMGAGIGTAIPTLQVCSGGIVGTGPMGGFAAPVAIILGALLGTSVGLGVGVIKAALDYKTPASSLEKVMGLGFLISVGIGTSFILAGSVGGIAAMMLGAAISLLAYYEESIQSVMASPQTHTGLSPF
ncbi:hypothetical protein J2N86_04780 [Legionella lytica]|uniref:Transmembrane protein n=1 Tax=Legionella lytica TaxID=96232 RepID=A0ABY4YB13_9GAMM|nr:hypothetical protein [Legionella lytica]USQ14631.1 hypothetical protein J2N86_04780 [Legionella lytica]